MHKLSFSKEELKMKSREEHWEQLFKDWGLGSNGTAKSLKTFPLFLMALTHHALLHRALQMNNAQAY